MSDIVWHASSVTADERRVITGGRGVTVWLTGLSGSGKSTIGHLLEERLVREGRAAYVLDGDNLRHGLNGDLGFSPDDRTENVRRIGEVARLMADAGLVAIVPVISPYRLDRQRVRTAHEAADLPFLEVWVATPLEVCEQRDPKGLYRKARAGELASFTGIDAPYEEPDTPDLVVDTSDGFVDESVVAVLEILP